MFLLKILLPLFIILFAYSVKCEDLKEVKRFGWLRAWQKYQYNHPPNVESEVSPVVYDKVIDKASRARNLVSLSLTENSTDRSPFDKNVSVLENEENAVTYQTTTTLLDVESTSDFDSVTTTNVSEDATEFPEGFTTSSIYKRRFKSQSKSAPVTTSHDDENIQIASNETYSRLSSYRHHNRQRPNADRPETADSRTESKDYKTESNASHLISTDRENKINETESVLETRPNKPGLRRQRKHKNRQYNNNKPQDSNEGNTTSKINIDLEDTQIVRMAILTNKDPKLPVENVNNERSGSSSQNAQGTRRYFRRPQKVALGRQYNAEILSSPANETKSIQTNNTNILETSSIINITKYNEAKTHPVAGNVTTSLTNSETVTTPDDITVDLSTQTKGHIRKFLQKPQKNTTYHEAKDFNILIKNAASNIQAKKTETSENIETVQLSDNPARENISKNKSESIGKTEVTPRKYLRRPHISSNDNASQLQTEHTKKKSNVSSNIDSVAAEVDNDYESKSQSALHIQHLQNTNTDFSDTLSTTQRENVADEQTKLIQSVVTNDELITNTESTNSQVTDTIIPTESANEDNSKLVQTYRATTLSQLKPQITTTRRYSSSTSSSVSPNLANDQDINITPTYHEKRKPNTNFSKLRNGSRGHITYQSSKVDMTTDDINSVNHNVKAQRKRNRPLNEKTRTTTSYTDTEIADRLSIATKASFQHKISKVTTLENFVATQIPELKPNEPLTQSIEYKNVYIETDKASDPKSIALPKQDNVQALTSTTESQNTHTQTADNYAIDINPTTEQYNDKQPLTENVMQITRNIKTYETTMKLNECYEDTQQTTNLSRIVKSSNTKPIKSQQITKVGASSLENQSTVNTKDLNEVVEETETLNKLQSIKTTKITIPFNSKQGGIESEVKYSTATVAVSTTEKTITLGLKTEPNVNISGNQIETSILTQSRTKTEINNSEIKNNEAIKSTVSASLNLIDDVIDENPAENNFELDTQAKTQYDRTPKTENSSSQNSKINYSRTSRLHGDRDRVVPIIEFENRVFSQNGKFVYSYEGADGTRAFSNGQLKEISKDHAGEAVEGGFSYTDQDGNDFSLSYTADENGYRPVGAHLPTPPPIPPAIARALAFLATKTTPAPITEPSTIK